MNIRMSAGTAMNLGLKNGQSLEEPTTAYVMIPGGTCRGGCPYCPQSHGAPEKLSRITWPEYDSEEIVEEIKNSDLERICIQSPDIEGYEEKIKCAVDELQYTGKPISLSTPPLSKETLEDLSNSIDRIGIGLDSATDELRKKTKPKYDPKVFWEYFGRASEFYGSKNVTVHLIVGMGETLEELATTIKKVYSLDSNVSLFSYLYEDEAPDIKYYRKAQILNYLIGGQGKNIEESFEILSNEPDKLESIIDNGHMFQTQGCPGCNRPYYTTKPGEEHRNFPRMPNKAELVEIKKELEII
ncbi:MAG: radical SAM protein [Thermoplasmatota archaeon]